MPNIQQIPTDGRLRGLFRAADGHALVLGEYGSMELRAAGCISGDRKLLNVFEQGLDLHAMAFARSSPLPSQTLLQLGLR
jgi:DNA polymerase I